jgi:Flp pilus assembly protein TadG
MTSNKKFRRDRRGSRSSRRGVAAVEGAIILSVFLLILFAMLDLGLLVLNYNTLCEAARRLARQAIVHGQMAAPVQTVWGPDQVTGTGSDRTDYAAALSPELVTFELGNVNYSIEWPAGTNRPDDPVQVTVTYAYQPIIPFVLGGSAVPIRAVTNMSVEH